MIFELAQDFHYALTAMPPDSLRRRSLSGYGWWCCVWRPVSCKKVRLTKECGI